MYHERSNDWGFGSAFALVVALGLLMAFLTVKATLLIVHTLLRYPKKRILWVFLAVFVGSLVVGLLLGYWFKSAAFLSLGAVGFVALTLTCYIVDTANSQTLLKEPESIVKTVLGSCKRQEDSEPRAVAKLSHLLALQTIRTTGPVSANSGESESSRPPW